MTEISDDIVINVFNVVCAITFVIASVYPVVYIIRSMIEFVSKAFTSIRLEKVFKMKPINLGQKEKARWEKEF